MSNHPGEVIGCWLNRCSSVVQTGAASQVEVGRWTQLSPDEGSNVNTVQVCSMRAVALGRGCFDSIEDDRGQVEGNRGTDTIRIPYTGRVRIGLILRVRAALVVVSVVN